MLGVSCAERIGNYLRLSQRIGNGRRPVRRLLRFAVSWNVLRVRAQRAKKKFAFSLLRRTADFRPPVTPCEQIFALRYENLFCPESVHLTTLNIFKIKKSKPLELLILSRLLEHARPTSLTRQQREKTWRKHRPAPTPRTGRGHARCLAPPHLALAAQHSTLVSLQSGEPRVSRLLF